MRWANFVAAPLLLPIAAHFPLQAAQGTERISFTQEPLTTLLCMLVLLLLGLIILLTERDRRREKALRQAEKAKGREAGPPEERDKLTGVYSKEKWQEAATGLLKAHNEGRFVLVRMQLDRFALVNEYLGESEGNALLCHIAEELRAYAASHAPCAFGRVEEDVFAFLCPYSGRTAIQEDASALLAEIQKFDPTFDISASFGFCVVRDGSVTADVLLARAALASESVKDGGAATGAFYTDEMGLNAEREKMLVDGMRQALAEDRFRILIQPNFDLKTGDVCGGEALARWYHKDLGVISPGVFVPVFEKNGLITQLDIAMWEQVCQKLRAWTDAGLAPFPVSVNVSRVNLYDPRIVDTFLALVAKYNLPPRLLPLELTESAYRDNPKKMQQVVRRLREHGFRIVLDDFGSGASALGMLKDIDIDCLKVDMHALGGSDAPERRENLVASIVRMAKWLELPVIAEGVETREQVAFLQRIGCDVAQGFYYAYPLEPETYVAMKPAAPVKAANAPDVFDINTLWADNSQMELLFSDAPQAAGLYEYDDKKHTLDCLRVNRKFSEMFGYLDAAIDNNPFANAVLESKATLIEAADAAVETRSAAECEYLRHDGADDKWINLKFKYVSSTGSRHILLGSFFDVSAYKKMEIELFKYRSAVADIGKTARRMLVVDDQKINRDILRRIFMSEFTVLDAASGEEALSVLAPPDGDADIILLDMRMPGMGGESFLKIKQADKRLEPIPVIIVTAEDSSEQQINMLALGAYDYIVKPLIPEVIRRRVHNVLESSQRFRVMLREYQEAVSLAKADPLTRVYNRAAAEEEIGRVLRDDPNRRHAMVMIDIDDYKNVNDTYGHSCGDLVLMEFGNKLAHYFRAGDIVARMGGDEFCVLMVGVPSGQVALNKCSELCNSIRSHAIGEQMVRISCSAGIAISETGMPFDKLYERADEALYQAKHGGKGMAVLFGDTQGKEAE